MQGNRAENEVWILQGSNGRQIKPNMANKGTNVGSGRTCNMFIVFEVHRTVVLMNVR